MNSYLQAIDLSAQIESVMSRIEEIREEIDEFGETIERREELGLQEQALLHLADEATEFLVACQDIIDRSNHEEERLKEKANRILLQSKRHGRRAAAIKRLAVWFLEVHHPEGVKTDEGKFYLGTSKAVDVDESFYDDYDQLAKFMESHLQSNLGYLPLDIKDAEIQINPTVLNRCDLLDVSVKVTPNKAAIKKAISEQEIPGYSMSETHYLRLSKPKK